MKYHLVMRQHGIAFLVRSHEEMELTNDVEKAMEYTKEEADRVSAMHEDDFLIVSVEEVRKHAKVVTLLSYSAVCPGCAEEGGEDPGSLH